MFEGSSDRSVGRGYAVGLYFVQNNPLVEEGPRERIHKHSEA